MHARSLDIFTNKLRMYEAWAAGEAALMRAVAVHGLTLARRASSSKSLGLKSDIGRLLQPLHLICTAYLRTIKIQMLKDLIGQTLGGTLDFTRTHIFCDGTIC